MTKSVNGSAYKISTKRIITLSRTPPSQPASIPNPTPMAQETAVAMSPTLSEICPP